MKKAIISLLLALLWVGQTWAEVKNVTVDGILYEIDTATKKATVAANGYDGRTIEISIPGSINVDGAEYAVESIAEYTFIEDPKRSITIPESVKSIGRKAFAHTRELRCISIRASEPPTLGEYAFLGSFVEIVFVPCGSVEKYEKAEGWKELKDEGTTFVPSQHNITFTTEGSRNWGFHGTIEVLEASCEPSKITVTAKPLYEYGFVKWSDGVTENPRTILLDKDTALMAEFVPVSKTYLKIDDLWYVIDPTEHTATVSKNEGDPYTLTSVTIPESVTYEGDECAVTAIDSFAFAGCNKLENIRLSSYYPPTLGKGAFDGVAATSIIVPCDTKEYEAADGWKDLGIPFSAMGKELIPISLNSNNKMWGEADFKDISYCPYQQVSVWATPASDQFAFSKWSDGNTENPRTILLEKETSLTAEFVPVSKTYLKIDDLWYVLDPTAHTATVSKNEGDPYTLTSVTIPESATYEGDEYAVTGIDIFAFEGCDKLASVTFKSSIPPAHGDGAFFESGVTTISVPCGSEKAYEEAGDWKDMGTAIVGKGHTITLASNNDAWGTAKVTVPATCESPEETIQASIATIEVAFEKWSDGVAQNPRTVVLDKDTALTAIFVPLTELPRQKIGDLWYRLIPASHTAFVIRNTADPYTQTEINIPASVEYDGEEYAVTMLNDSAFYYCKNLKSVTIPESVKRIASRVFYGCNCLTSVEFPDNLNIIGAYAFGDCKVLTSITLPKAMTGLGWGAFRYCSNLTSISIEAPVPPTIDQFAFGDVAAKTITVPCGAEDAYESAEGWKSLNKTFSEATETVINATITKGESYTQNGFDESKAGIYTQRLLSAGGCDSIVTLRLTVIGDSPIKGKIYGETVFESFFTTIDELKGALEGYYNTIVAFADVIPSGWTELPNVVVNGKAKSIKLKDRPYTYDGEINAESAEFLCRISVIDPRPWKRWLQSFAIPFEGEANIQIAPSNQEIEPNTSYLQASEFVASKGDTLIYKRMDEAKFKANVPYLIKFIGDGYSTDMVISATNTIVHSGASVTIDSETVEMKTIYNRSSDTDAFTYIDDYATFVQLPSCDPFSAYAVSKCPTGIGLFNVPHLVIADAEEIGYTTIVELPTTTALAVYAENGDIVIRASEAGTTSVYSISGQMMRASVIYGEGETHISGLGAGTYVVAGRKVVLK